MMLAGTVRHALGDNRGFKDHLMAQQADLLSCLKAVPENPAGGAGRGGVEGAGGGTARQMAAVGLVGDGLGRTQKERVRSALDSWCAERGHGLGL